MAVAVGLVDQGSRGGGGKIWQRGGPGGGGGDGAVAVVVAAAVVSVAVVAAVVSTTATEDQGQPLVGLLLGLGGDHRHTQCFGDIWLLFGILFSICVFVGIPKIDEYLAFYSCYK